ncbi:uncharacterized protein TRAVEDRAFT_42697 [Trametes versicolor FP-101664 SS1]|uniref:uncharacterized protein n=1 Tax=Trametes versicolor (strain FP-101664) TaxID=717944 RepID=UPI000462307A|nr:uncharacterized protein TRAVEDRAFT_42697 [Trametes versicolor FP-101664 SS1]EIW65317.1 hypothetical protein TRAVEDRAFT_42697 [Trametes versicolor FP-101664 SS1]
MKQLLIDLGHHVNGICPIGRLPAEILVLIFRKALQLSGYGAARLLLNNSQARRVPIHMHWTLTRVCAKWRALALSTPSLWTCIDDRDAGSLLAFIARSQPLPLSLRYILSEDWDLQRLHGALRDWGARLGRLDIMEYPCHDLQWTHQPIDLSVQVASLHCLTISAERDSLWDAPAYFLGSGVSNLKALALGASCEDLFPAGIHFPHLTHLSLAFWGSEIEVYKDDAHDLITLLSNTPALRYVHLSGVGDPSTEPSPLPPAPVVLRSLRALTCVGCKLSSAFQLLESLTLPEDVVVRLDNLRSVDGQPTVFPRRVASERFLASFARLQVWYCQGSLHLAAEGAKSGLWIRVTDPKWDEVLWKGLVAALPAMISLVTIRTLRFSVWAPSTLSLIAHMPSLTELQAYADADYVDTQSVLKALCIMLGRGGGRSCLPTLESLLISAHSEDLQSGIPETLQMVAARSEMGIPLARLILQPLPTPYGKSEDETSREMMLIRKIFSQDAIAPIREHVSVVEVMETAEPPPCPFEMGEMWEVDAFEDYWELTQEEKPDYKLHR